MLSHRIVRDARRPDPEAVAALAGQGVATVHEAQGRRGLVGPRVVARQEGTVVAGRAVTALCPPGDNLMVHAAIEQCGPGDVLVVATTSTCTDGMLGDLMATSLQARGVVGVVCAAGIRDVAELRGMGFAAWSAAVHAQGCVKASAGSVNVPVVVHGATVRPGDVVVADDDGVCVVPCEDAPAVAEVGAARLRRETAKRARLAAGELALDLDGLRALLERLGVDTVDAPPDPVELRDHATACT